MVSSKALALSAEPLVGLKPTVQVLLIFRVTPFSRTPRGFEAGEKDSFTNDDDELSAEPLVGLKPDTV